MTTEAEGEEALSRKIEDLEKQLHALRLQQKAAKSATKPAPSTVADLPLELQGYIRYGRQMILPQIGLPGQLALKNASVLVIGAGGLGCPALLYLAAAGVGIALCLLPTKLSGTIGIADLDCVELSNLHRQVLHRTSTIGEHKVASAKRALQELLKFREVI
jgi:adenylyltransferase and sulfurtransferase